MRTPFFSIVMPVYNRRSLVGIAIESVIKQKFQDWELIVIDDGSTDDSVEVIKGFKDPRVKYFYQVNQERSRARNNGIAKSSGEFICFLDSDDYYLEDHLLRLHDFIEEKEFKIGLYATGANVIRDDKTEIKLPLYEDTSLHPVKQIFYNKLDMNTTCTHHSILEKIQFNPTIRIGEDTHLWLRIVMEHPFYQVPYYTTVTVNHETSGMVAYYRDADIKLLEEYVQGAKDIFNRIDLSAYISSSERRLYISKKYRGMAFCCIWARKMNGAVYCITEAIRWTPSYFFCMEMVKFFKEYFYMMGRIILKKDNRR